MKDLNEYLNERWEKLSSGTKNILNLEHDEVNRMHLQLLWSLQWVREKEAELASLQVGG